MADAWQCDICGKLFTENDVYFSSKYGINISIRGYTMELPFYFKYADACKHCRMKIGQAINETIESIKNNVNTPLA